MFNLDDVETLVRKVFRTTKSIDLRDYDLTPYVIPAGFEIRSVSFHPKRYKKEVKEVTEGVITDLEQEGYNLYNLFTPIYETLLNAFQHANKKRQGNSRIKGTK